MSSDRCLFIGFAIFLFLIFRFKVELDTQQTSTLSTKFSIIILLKVDQGPSLKRNIHFN